MQKVRVKDKTQKFNYLVLKNRQTPRDKAFPRLPKGFPAFTIALLGRDYQGKADPGVETFLVKCDWTTHSIEWKNKAPIQELALGSWSETWDNYYRLKRDFSKEKYPFLFWIKVVRILDLVTLRDLAQVRARVWQNDALAMFIHENRKAFNLLGLEREIGVPKGTLADYTREGVPFKHRDKIVRYLQGLGREIHHLTPTSKNYLTAKTEKGESSER